MLRMLLLTPTFHAVRQQLRHSVTLWLREAADGREVTNVVRGTPEEGKSRREVAERERKRNETRENVEANYVVGTILDEERSITNETRHPVF